MSSRLAIIPMIFSSSSHKVQICDDMIYVSGGNGHDLDSQQLEDKALWMK